MGNLRTTLKKVWRHDTETGKSALTWPEWRLKQRRMPVDPTPAASKKREREAREKRQR